MLVAGLSKNSTPSYAVYCSLNSGLQFLFATEPFVLALQRLETDEGVQELLRRHSRSQRQLATEVAEGFVQVYNQWLSETAQIKQSGGAATVDLTALIEGTDEPSKQRRAPSGTGLSLYAKLGRLTRQWLPTKMFDADDIVLVLLKFFGAEDPFLFEEIAALTCPASCQAAASRTAFVSRTDLSLTFRPPFEARVRGEGQGQKFFIEALESPFDPSSRSMYPAQLTDVSDQYRRAFLDGIHTAACAHRKADVVASEHRFLSTHTRPTYLIVSLHRQPGGGDYGSCLGTASARIPPSLQVALYTGDTLEQHTLASVETVQGLLSQHLYRNTGTIILRSKNHFRTVRGAPDPANAVSAVLCDDSTVTVVHMHERALLDSTIMCLYKAEPQGPPAPPVRHRPLNARLVRSIFDRTLDDWPAPVDQQPWKFVYVAESSLNEAGKYVGFGVFAKCDIQQGQVLDETFYDGHYMDKRGAQSRVDLAEAHGDHNGGSHMLYLESNSIIDGLRQPTLATHGVGSLINSLWTRQEKKNQSFNVRMKCLELGPERLRKKKVVVATKALRKDQELFREYGGWSMQSKPCDCESCVQVQ